MIEPYVAQFSPDRMYRYTLWRCTHCGVQDCLHSRVQHGWNGVFVQWICLNPSIADEKRNDPTMRRCIDYSRAWGYHHMVMTNLFAFRATDPRHMKQAEDPVGLYNDLWLDRISSQAALIMAAWGNEGGFLGRDHTVGIDIDRLGKMFCLKQSKNGNPYHPLYLSKTLQPIPYTRFDEEADPMLRLTRRPALLPSRP